MSQPLKMKAVLVGMYQPDNGMPGEFSLYLDRDKPEALDLSPEGFSGRAWLLREDVLMLEVGVGSVQAAVAIMSLGMSARFDFSEALWLIAGIAGGNPRYVALGTTVWADYCVDTDFAFEIDPREIPAEWDVGLFPFGGKFPYDPEAYDINTTGQTYVLQRLDLELVDWARRVSSRVEHVTCEAAREETARFPRAFRETDEAINTTGTVLSGARFWHGEKMQDWAEKWAAYWTKGRSPFLACGMEDSGTLHALKCLGQVGRVKAGRVLLLRSVCNFTSPPPGRSAVDNLVSDSVDAHFPGLNDALENSYRVVSAILNEWLPE